MTFRLIAEDVDLLATVADHRILAVRQLQTVLNRNLAALRRRLRLLREEGLIGLVAGGMSGRPGRPGHLVSVRPTGVALLKSHGRLHQSIPVERVVSETISCPEHHLLLNEIRVQLACVERFIPSLAVRFLASYSPGLYAENYSGPFIHERFTVAEETGEEMSFTPDAIFAVSDAERKKTVMFYLEIDMGTEPHASRDPLRHDVRQKIVNYKACFRTRHYSRHQQTFGSALQGFRLLFLTHDAGRLSSLCRQVREMRPSVFIWLTDKASLTEQGVWGPIWIPGGNTEGSRQSILGSRAPSPSPKPEKLP